MNILWVSIALITAGVVVAVILPVLRFPKNGPAHKDRFEFDVAVYKDQLEEIDGDLDRGLLTPDQADAVRTEIQRKLLVSATSDTANKPGTSFLLTERSAAFTIMVVGIFITVGAISIYSILGSPNLRNIAYADRDIEQEKTEIENWQAGQDMDALLDQVARRLKQNPEDIKGWKLLGRSLIARGRYEDSVAAYKQAADRRPDDPDIVVDYAEALIFANEGKVTKVVFDSLQKISKSAPANPKIRYYIGQYKAQNDNLAGALQEWTDIATISPKDAPWMPTVRQQMETAFKDTGLTPSAIKPSASALKIAATMDLSPTPGPTAEDVAAARQLSAGDQADMINGMVSRLAGKLEANPNDPDGWARLGRSYQTLNRNDESKRAYQKAYELAPDNIDIALAYGEILVVIDQGYVNSTARALFEHVLSADPKNVKARFYFGMALAETEEETPRAIQVWEALLKELPKDAPWTASLIEHIKRAKQTTTKKAS